jgi:molybdopterin biosynthesis enzyme
VSAGEAVEIMTGAPLPNGADAVVMVEHTEREGNRVRVGRTLTPSENFGAQGCSALGAAPWVRPDCDAGNGRT